MAGFLHDKKESMHFRVKKYKNITRYVIKYFKYMTFSDSVVKNWLLLSVVWLYPILRI